MFLNNLSQFSKTPVASVSVWGKTVAIDSEKAQDNCCRLNAVSAFDFQCNFRQLKYCRICRFYTVLNNHTILVSAVWVSSVSSSHKSQKWAVIKCQITKKKDT